jgi:hypothetical protein
MFVFCFHLFEILNSNFQIKDKIDQSEIKVFLID